MRLFAGFMVMLLACSGAAGAEITLVSQVRALKSAEASEARPVHLRGVVTVLSGWKSSFFFQDGSAGISVDPSGGIPTVHAGEEIEITGITDAGLFAPTIRVSSIKSLGKGKLPASRIFSYEQLQRGEQDSQWIEFAGIVHSAGIVPLWGHPVLRMLIETGGGVIETRVREFGDVDPGSLVDANVRIRGACATDFNDKRQILGVRAFVSDMSNVNVLQPASKDLFVRPVLAIGDLQRFGPGGDLIASHMVRVRGTATYQSQGRSLYLQDGENGLLVNTTKEFHVSTGETIDAVGFMSPHERTPTLTDARIRVSGPGTPVIAAQALPADVIRLKTDGFWSTPYESLVVSVKGRLVDVSRAADGKTLLLRDGETLFRARVNEVAAMGEKFDSLETGTLLKLRGVCSIYRDENGTPVSFTVMIRDAAEVEVLQGPTWLNTKRLLWLASLLLLIAATKAFLFSRERSRIKQELSASQRRFEVFLNNCPAVAFIKDQEGRMVWMNETGERLTGVKLSEWKGKTDFDILPENVANQLRTNDLAAQTVGGCIAIVETLPHPDGDVRHYLSNKFPFFSEAGPMLGGMSLDITKRVETERLLRKSELRYRELFEQNPVPAWVYCLQTLSFLDVNDAAVSHYGYSRMEFLNLKLQDIEAGEGRHRRKDGSEIRVETRSHEIETNSKPCRLVMANDITERLVSEEKFRVLFEQSSEAHLLMDEEAQVLDCNPAAVDMLRAENKAQVVGMTLSQSPEYFEIRAKHLATLQEQGAIRFDCTHRRFDGTDLQLEVSVTKVCVASQSLTLEVWHDLTRRKETEKRLQLEALTDPLTGLANRRHFTSRIEAELQSAKLEDTSLVLCVCDIDHFKQVNDRYGHSAGDAVLVTVGDFIRNGIRKSDFVARLGGDEFCIVLQGTTAANAEMLIGRIRNRIEQVTFGMCPGRPFGITTTFGLAELQSSHLKGADLFEAADQALYKAKEQGRNRIVIAA